MTVSISGCLTMCSGAAWSDLLIANDVIVVEYRGRFVTTERNDPSWPKRSPRSSN